ncbi:MAG TPA: MMPL family transporter [Rhodoferax sp.]|nr:MMPL family transporter [Rhodoferax sp.]
MKSLKLRIFLLWLLCMLAGSVVVWNSRFSADMSFFLPSKPSAEQRALVGQLQDGTVSRLLMLSIEGADAAQRASVSRELRQRLANNPAYVSVQNGEAGGLEGERDVLLRYRYQLSPSVSPDRFTEAGLRAAVANTIDLLSSPAGLMFKPYLARDPTGELLEVIAQFNPGAQPETRAGVWASRNGERAMLLAQTRAQGSDTDGQAAVIADLQQVFAQVLSAQHRSGMTLQISGPGKFAVQARETIQAEVSRLFFVSMAGIVGVLLWVYRSPRLLALGLLPMLSGALAGVAVVSLVHGTVFGITVGFGSALIGEAVDYAIYFFVQSGRMGLDNWRRVFWPTVRLGVLTSALGFGALLFSGFPGLSQLGLYALSGVVTAALVTRFVLPTLAGAQFCVPAPRPWVHRVLTGLVHAHRLRALVGLLALLAGGYLWQQRASLWDANLSALSTVSQAEAAADSRMRADLAAPDARYLVTIGAADQESALQAAERAGAQLDRLVEQGVIGGYDSPARFLPSTLLQTRRLVSLPVADVLQTRLRAALIDSPLGADKLAPFVADVQAARSAGVMRRADLNGSALALVVDSMLMPVHSGGWTVMMPLRPAANAPDADIPPEKLRTALAGSGALFVDLKAEFDALYSGYMDQAVRLSLAGFLAIVVLLALTLRSRARLLRVLLALVLTVLGVIALLHLAGVRLHLLHLVGMLLIVAVGSNYALFFDRAAGGEPLDAATLLSIAVATLTTAIGFGALALSSVPVLQAIGVTVGPGAVLALLLSAVLVYPAGGRCPQK